MADFPGAIHTPVLPQNVLGEDYDPLNLTRIYREHFEFLANEIVALETILGLNPQGDFDTVGERIEAAAAGGGEWVKETPTGAINGSNTIFELSDVPAGNSLSLTLGRQVQIEGVDFTILGDEIHYVSAPLAELSGEPHQATYSL